MKQSVNVYNFDDFFKYVKTAGAYVIVPSFKDFSNY